MFGRNQKNSEDQSDRPAARPPLQWSEDERVQVGSVIGTINSARRQDGSRIFSWCIGKEGRNNRDNRVMKFCDPRDISDAHNVLDDIDDWIEKEKKSERLAQ